MAQLRLADLPGGYFLNLRSPPPRNLSTWKVMTSIKSIKEAMDLQTRLTRTSVESIVAETRKLAEASMKLAEQTMVPITARITLAAEKFSPPTIQE